MENWTGALARSKAGHDKGNIFLIIKDEQDIVWMTDGKNRTVSNPKKKKKKHLQYISFDNWMEKPYNDDDIKRTIKLYKQHCKENSEL